MENLQNLTAEDLKDGFDDWYDQALKSGAGFKTDEEKAAYLASLGDPEKHPMFATKTEDLVGNPLADALRALREEDKTLVQIAQMYKEDANELVKKSKTASSSSSSSSSASVTSSSSQLHEAVNTYLHAITFVDQAMQARANGTEAEQDKDVNLDVSKSQLHSNIAQVWLTLENYRSCINEANLAIACWNGNSKAHFRKCKALLKLKKYDECIAAANESMEHNTNAADQTAINELVNICNVELQKKALLEQQNRQARRALQQEWGKVFIHTTKRNNELKARYAETATDLNSVITFGYCNDILPTQLNDLYPTIDAESNTLCVPVLLLYPQHNQLDVIQMAKTNVLLVEYLAEMFPEFEDGVQAVSWDTDREFQISSLVVYCPMQQQQGSGGVGVVSNMNEWIQACTERRQLQGLEGTDAAEEARETLKARVTSSSSSSSSSTTTSGFVEVHFGCSIEQVLRLPGCVLAGGVLTLFVFVKGNASHKEFMSKSKASKVTMLKLQPNESISVLKIK